MIARLRLVLTLALRDLRRQTRRSLLAAAAMTVGGALLMITLPLGDGSHEERVESSVRMRSGHIAIQTPDYQTSRKIVDRLSAEARAAAETALQQPRVANDVLAVVPRLATDALASSTAGARPVQIVGVDPAVEPAFSTLDEKLVEGRYLRPDDRLAAFVGAGLAEGLDLHLGERLVLNAQDADGEIAGQLVRVIGIFRNGIPEVEQRLIHMPLATAGTWLSVGADVTSIAVLIDSSRRLRRVQRALRHELAAEIESGSLTLLAWHQAMPELAAAVRIDDLGNYVWQLIIFGIIGLGIVNTVLMSVLHRRREFGLLRALGLTPWQTGGLVMVEGLLLTTVSGLIGIGLGLFITWFFWRDGLDISFVWNEEWTFSGAVMDTVVIPQIRLMRVIQGFVFIMAIGMLASLYPAYRATRIEVADAMKFER